MRRPCAHATAAAASAQQARQLRERPDDGHARGGGLGELLRGRRAGSVEPDAEQARRRRRRSRRCAAGRRRSRPRRARRRSAPHASGRCAASGFATPTSPLAITCSSGRASSPAPSIFADWNSRSPLVMMPSARAARSARRGTAAASSCSAQRALVVHEVGVEPGVGRVVVELDAVRRHEVRAPAPGVARGSRVRPRGSGGSAAPRARSSARTRSARSAARERAAERRAVRSDPGLDRLAMREQGVVEVEQHHPDRRSQRPPVLRRRGRRRAAARRASRPGASRRGTPSSTRRARPCSGSRPRGRRAPRRRCRRRLPADPLDARCVREHPVEHGHDAPRSCTRDRGAAAPSQNPRSPRPRRQPDHPEQRRRRPRRGSPSVYSRPSAQPAGHDRRARRTPRRRGVYGHGSVASVPLEQRVLAVLR